MTTGPELVAAINGNADLMGVNNCPGVSVALGDAFYGSVQNDDNGVILTPANIATEISAAGNTANTAVWHFLLTPVHHFVIVPWYQQDPPQQCYTVYMAYEVDEGDGYTIGEYVAQDAPAPETDQYGYKEAWNFGQISEMLNALLAGGTAWEDYFGDIGNQVATQIEMFKYAWIPLNEDLVDQVRTYVAPE